MNARIGRNSLWWYVTYQRTPGTAWGRYHYGSLATVLWCWWRVKRGKPPPAHMRPYGEHL